MSDIDESGPAFPLDSNQYGAVLGMSLRDYFAAKASIEAYAPVDTLYRKLGRNPTVNELAEWIADVRYIEAAFMIARRSQP
jgi:hypothetical protein